MEYSVPALSDRNTPSSYRNTPGGATDQSLYGCESPPLPAIRLDSDIEYRPQHVRSAPVYLPDGALHEDFLPLSLYLYATAAAYRARRCIVLHRLPASQNIAFPSAQTHASGTQTALPQLRF